MVFAEWNTRAGLSCVSTEHWWLLANLFSLFSSCIKLPIFQFRWGCEAVLRCYFFLLHTHHLWSLGISDKFPDCPKCRLVSTQGDQDPSLGLSLFVWQWHHSHLKYWALMQRALCVWRACKRGNMSVDRNTRVTRHSWFSSVHFLFWSPLRCAMLLLASCFLELSLS